MTVTTPYDFEYYISRFDDYLNLPNEETRINFYHKACEEYCLYILEKLMDLHISLSEMKTLSQQDAQNLMSYGVGRRAGMLLHSFRELFFIIPPDRERRTSYEESCVVDTHLNSVYINIRGLLDNLGCVYFCEKERINLVDLKPAAKQLFNKKIIKQSDNQNFWQEILVYEQWWHNELKELRDPVAHSMPLYIMSGIIVGDDDLDKYNKHYSDYEQYLANGNFEKAKNSLDASESSFQFYPIFAHSPKASFKLYPTITKDLANMLKIFNLVYNDLTCQH